MEFSSKMYTDQTGRFPLTSAIGYKCIMVECEQDSNAIMVDPMKSPVVPESAIALVISNLLRLIWVDAFSVIYPPPLN